MTFEVLIVPWIVTYEWSDGVVQNSSPFIGPGKAFSIAETAWSRERTKRIEFPESTRLVSCYVHEMRP